MTAYMEAIAAVTASAVSLKKAIRLAPSHARAVSMSWFQKRLSLRSTIGMRVGSSPFAGGASCPARTPPSGGNGGNTRRSAPVAGAAPRGPRLRPSLRSGRGRCAGARAMFARWTYPARVGTRPTRSISHSRWPVGSRSCAKSARLRSRASLASGRVQEVMSDRPQPLRYTALSLSSLYPKRACCRAPSGRDAEKRLQLARNA